MVTRRVQAVGSIFRVVPGYSNMNDEQRPFGFWTATAFVIGGVIGAGIFVLPSQLASYGWTGAAAWVFGGAGAIVIALVLAAIAAARPQEPGLVAVIGEVLGPVVGVLTGWGAWVSYWCANAYIALTAARYASEFWAPLGATPLRLALGGSLVMVGLTLLNLTGLRASGRFQVVTTALRLLPMAAVLIIVVLLMLGGGADFAREPEAPFVASNLFAASSLAFVAIVGFESASIAAQRVRNPERNIPRATIGGVALCCLIYLIVCTGIDFALPQAAVAESKAPVALFIAHYWGSWAGLAVAAFAVISTVGCLSVWVLLQGEIPLGLVRAGLLPEWLARTNREDIAVTPIVLGSTLTIVLLVAASWRDGAAVMDFMLRLTAVTAIWIYAFACLAALRLRVRMLAAALGLGFALAILYGAGLEAVLLSIALMAVALPLYWLARRSLITTAKSSAAAAGRPE